MEELEQFETTEYKNCTVVVTKNKYTGQETISWFRNDERFIDVDWEEVDEDDDDS